MLAEVSSGRYVGLTVRHFCKKLTAMEQYTSEDARREWRRILNAVESGEPVGITRYGKPLAVVVPAGWYEQAQAAIESIKGCGPS